MLGGVGPFDFEPLDEGAGREFAVTELFDDGDAGGMGESLGDWLRIFAVSNKAEN
jgi:hypothetical protein